MTIRDSLRWEYGLEGRHVGVIASVAAMLIGYFLFLPASQADRAVLSLLTGGVIALVYFSHRCTNEERFPFFAWSVVALGATFIIGTERALHTSAELSNYATLPLEMQVTLAIASTALLVAGELFVVLVGSVLYQRYMSGGSGGTPEERVLSDEELENFPPIDEDDDTRYERRAVDPGGSV